MFSADCRIPEMVIVEHSTVLLILYEAPIPVLYKAYIIRYISMKLNTSPMRSALMVEWENSDNFYLSEVLGNWISYGLMLLVSHYLGSL